MVSYIAKFNIFKRFSQLWDLHWLITLMMIGGILEYAI